MSTLLATGVALTVQPLSAAGGSPVEGEPTPTLALVAGSGDEPAVADIGSAVIAATQLGEPVEILDRTTEYVRHLASPDGSVTFEAYVAPQRVLREGGWVPVDPTLQVVDGRVAPVATLLDVSLSAGSDDELMRLTDGPARLSLIWPVPLPEPVLSAATARYPEVFPGVDLLISVDAEAVGLLLEVKSRQAGSSQDLARLAWGTSTDGVLLRADERGAIEAVSEATGEVVFDAPSALMWDSPQVPDPPDENVPPEQLGASRVEAIPVELVDDQLVVYPDLDMLVGEDTIYPVFIDPSFGRPATNWAPVFRSRPSQAWPSGTNQPRNQIRVGNLDWPGCGSWCGVWRSLMRFHISEMSGSGYRLVGNPTFKIRLWHSASCSATPVALWRTNTIGSGNVTWNSMSSKWLQNFGTRSASANNGSCPQPEVDMTWSTSVMRDRLQAYMNANLQTFTFGLRAPNESDKYQWKYFSPSSPRLTATYNSVPDRPTAVKPQDGCAGSCTSPATVRITRPYLQARVRNELGGSVTAEFVLVDHASGGVVATGTNTVSNNAVARWRTPSLSSGKEYRFRVRAKNSSGLRGSWSSYFRFTVDTSGPAKPTTVGVDSVGDCYQTCGSPAILRASRPTFRATPQHPFGDSTSVVFEVHPANRASVIATATRSASPAGTKQTWRPSSALPQGELRLRVRSTSDNFGRSGSWSSWYHFTIDTVAPNTPTVTSPLYAHKDSGTWNGGVGRPGTFHFGPAGSVDVVTYQWRWNGGGTTYSADVSEGASHVVALTPPGDLEQLLEVRTVDYAGWASPWRAYPFYVRPQPADAGYWKFDEGSGTTAAAAVGGPEFTGALRGGATWAASGINPDDPAASGTAVSLNGTDGFVEMPPVLATNHAAGLTVSAWVNPAELTGFHTVFSLNGENTNMLWLYYTPDNPRWCLRATGSDDPAGERAWACSSITPQAGAWTHLTGVYDKPAGRIRLWVNGGPNNESPLPGDVVEVDAPAAWAATGSFTVGRAGSSGFWAGLIDEVRAYQRVVPEVEVVQMFRQCREASCPPVPEPEDLTLVGAWDFEETAGDLAEDGSGLNNPATRYDGAQWTAFGYHDTRGVSLDGASGYLGTAGQVLVTDQSFTVSAWVRLDQRDRWQAVVAQDGQQLSRFRLAYELDADAWCFRMRHLDQAGTGFARACGSTPQLGAWTHLVGVYDAAGLEIRLYIDGQLAGSAVYNQPGWEANGPFTIGRNLSFTGGGSRTFDFFGGTIDTVRAFQGAASDAQVGQWYDDQQAPPPESQPPVLAGDWRADDQSGGTVFEHTFSGNDGILSGGATWPGPGEAYAGQYGLLFDGASGAMTTSWPPILTDGSFTVSAWVRLDTEDVHQSAVALDGVVMSPFNLGYHADQGRFCFTMWHADQANAGSTLACAQQAPQLGRWTHLVGVFDKADRAVRLYLDGVLGRTETYAGLEPWAAGGPLVAGRALADSIGHGWWSGGVALVQTHHGPMTGAQVTDLYADQLDRRPTAVIETPSPELTWAAGQEVTFTGHGVDKDGQLPASALSWQLRARDCADAAEPDCEVETLGSWTGIAAGSFTAPDQAEPVYLELALTATTAAGSRTSVVELSPETVPLMFASDPEGLELVAGPVAAQTPFEVSQVAGATLTIAAPEPQQLGETRYVFDAWAHGGEATHQITVPDTTATYTASYRVYDPTPQAVIETPSPALSWAAGDTINFSGHAANTEGALPAEALSWQLSVEYCVTPEDCALEVLQQWQGVSAGSFATPNIPYASTVLILELTAEVTPDLIDVATVTLHPRLVDLTFETNPAGLQLAVANIEETAGFTRQVVQGATVELSAPEEQENDGELYAFDSWAHGGDSTHTIAAPATASSYTATYLPVATNTGSLVGTVTCQGSGLLVAGTQVTVAGQSTTTDSDGSWAIDNVPGGTQVVLATPPNTNVCNAASVEVEVVPAESTFLAIRLPENGCGPPEC